MYVFLFIARARIFYLTDRSYKVHPKKLDLDTTTTIDGPKDRSMVNPRMRSPRIFQPAKPIPSAK